MDIAIIGGGFFGSYLANKILKEVPKAQIDIFEQNKNLMLQAAVLNQCRLHRGFHYPQSEETIEQISHDIDSFVDEFKECITFPSNNIYAIAKGGKIDANEYFKTMERHQLKFKPLPKKEHKKYFRNAQQIESAILVNEGVIHVQKMRKKVLGSLSHIRKIYLETKVETVCGQSGFINGKHQYDFIINTTYTNPNLGLRPENCFDIKHELTAMVCLTSPFGNNTALTIMDGPYVSLYPCFNNLSTLSSVKYTPFIKTFEQDILEKEISNSSKHSQDQKIIDAIVNDAIQFLNINTNDLEIDSLWIAPKTKIRNDQNNIRLSKIICNQRVISVLCGKLSTANTIANSIISLLNK